MHLITVMEIATDDYGPQNDKLVAKIENGRNNSYRQTKAARIKQLEAMQKIGKCRTDQVLFR